MTGVLILNKPEDFTSFDLVAKARRICHEKKCGHSGTLDPMATGVMTILFGGATRFCELLPIHDKSYIAELKFGITTDTLDITGKVITESAFDVKVDDFKRVVKDFIGEITQIPPMYSAVSVNGQRLYNLARQGINIERPERKVTIYNIDIISFDEEKGICKISVSCSSGTYIRTLVSDIGDKLDCGAVLTSLQRTSANGFSLDDAISLDELQKASENGTINKYIIPIDKALETYPEVSVSSAQATRFHNGGELSIQRIPQELHNGIYRIYSPNHTFLGLGEVVGDTLNVKKIFVSEQVD